jgi:glycosyltransferase involved in cell wall biosynthesis
MLSEVEIAVLIPCQNEGPTIANVVQRFKKSLPNAQIYVYDNCSTDETYDKAQKAGALVRRESQLGKGCVVRRMFSDVEADVYVLVDGDDTYEAEAAPALIAELLSGPFDLVNGERLPASADAHPKGHLFGNKVLNALIRRFFGAVGADVLSGFKVMSRRFVKTFPTMSTGFEIETELVIHALELRMPTSEIKTRYARRREGSISKLHALRDGARIIGLISRLFREERPLYFFSILGGMLAFLSVLASLFETSPISTLSAPFLAAILGIGAIISVFSGLIIDALTRGRRELKRLQYLTHQAAGTPRHRLALALSNGSIRPPKRAGNGKLRYEDRYESGQPRENRPVGVAKFRGNAEN